MEPLQDLQAAAIEGGFVQVEECEEGTVHWLRKQTPDPATRTHQRICLDSGTNIAVVYWMTALGTVESKTLRSVSSLQDWLASQPAR
ncbi:MAG TPA: hypothetical protein VOA78_10410 [Candidatus Dormibacteraeota bacterium]|nr:hypothetical protein [Candidatus Dormibacteraeota bacterium]